MVLEERSHIVDAETRLLKEGHLIDDFGDGTLQLADVRAGILRDVHLDVFGDGKIARRLVAPVFVDEAFDDPELRLYFRRLDVNGSALVEAGVIALVDVDVFRCSVGREDDLLSLVRQLVEYLEHDVERLLFALQILDIVDQQHVGFFVARFEVLVAGLLLVVRRAGLHVIG